MSKCRETIEKDCDVTLTNKTNAEIERCSSVMKTFKEGIETCPKDKTGCACWERLLETLEDVKGCKEPGIKRV